MRMKEEGRHGILADVKPREMLDKSLLLFSCLRLILIPLLVYTGCLLFRVDALVTGVSVPFAAMPAASTTAIFAAKYEGDAVYASKCVVITTVLSLLATPVWSMILLRALYNGIFLKEMCTLKSINNLRPEKNRRYGG